MDRMRSVNNIIIKIITFFFQNSIRFGLTKLWWPARHFELIVFTLVSWKRIKHKQSKSKVYLSSLLNEFLDRKFGMEICASVYFHKIFDNHIYNNIEKTVNQMKWCQKIKTKKHSSGRRMWCFSFTNNNSRFVQHQPWYNFCLYDYVKI